MVEFHGFGARDLSFEFSTLFSSLSMFELLFRKIWNPFHRNLRFLEFSPHQGKSFKILVNWTQQLHYKKSMAEWLSLENFLPWIRQNDSPNVLVTAPLFTPDIWNFPCYRSIYFPTIEKKWYPAITRNPWDNWIQQFLLLIST